MGGPVVCFENPDINAEEWYQGGFFDSSPLSTPNSSRCPSPRAVASTPSTRLPTLPAIDPHPKEKHAQPNPTGVAGKSESGLPNPAALTEHEGKMPSRRSALKRTRSSHENAYASGSATVSEPSSGRKQRRRSSRGEAVFWERNSHNHYLLPDEIHVKGDGLCNHVFNQHQLFLTWAKGDLSDAATTLRHVKETPFIKFIFRKIVEEWTLATELVNPAEYIRYVNYCTTSYAFATLFHDHLDRKIRVSSNTKQGDLLPRFLELKEEMKDPVSVFNMKWAIPHVYINRSFKRWFFVYSCPMIGRTTPHAWLHALQRGKLVGMS